MLKWNLCQWIQKHYKNILLVFFCTWKIPTVLLSTLQNPLPVAGTWASYSPKALEFLEGSHHFEFLFLNLLSPPLQPLILSHQLSLAIPSISIFASTSLFLLSVAYFSWVKYACSLCLAHQFLSLIQPLWGNIMFLTIHTNVYLLFKS